MKRILLGLLLATMCLGTMAVSASADASIAAPRQLRGSSTGNAVSLSWQSVSGAAGYNVYRDNRYISTVSRTSYEDRGQRVGRYYVVAFDRSKTVFSSRSSEAVVRSGTSRPVAPAAPRARYDGTHGYVDIGWDAVPGAAGYNVYLNGEYYKTTSNTSYYEDTYQPGDAYYITAFDVTKTKFSSRSNVVRIPLGPPGPGFPGCRDC